MVTCDSVIPLEKAVLKTYSFLAASGKRIAITNLSKTKIQYYALALKLVF